MECTFCSEPATGEYEISGERSSFREMIRLCAEHHWILAPVTIGRSVATRPEYMHMIPHRGRLMGRKRQIVAALDAINSDQEIAHCEADALLYKAAPIEVREAYDRALERTGPWWYA